MRDTLFSNGLQTVMLAPVAVIALLGAMSEADATTIAFTATNLLANSWKYDYTLTNDSLPSPVQEFTIYFEADLYSNITLVSSPAEWDSIVIQPDSALPAAGFADALTIGSGLPAGSSLTGLSVNFDYLGAGIPGAQAFDIVDPVDFSTLDSGRTSAVPLPAAGWLLTTAFAAVIGAGLRRRKAPKSQS